MTTTNNLIEARVERRCDGERSPGDPDSCMRDGCSAVPSYLACPHYLLVCTEAAAALNRVESLPHEPEPRTKTEDIHDWLLRMRDFAANQKAAANQTDDWAEINKWDALSTAYFTAAEEIRTARERLVHFAAALKARPQ